MVEVEFNLEGKDMIEHGKRYLQLVCCIYGGCEAVALEDDSTYFLGQRSMCNGLCILKLLEH